MHITESIGLAVTSVRANVLRSVLTLLSISIGVAAIMTSTTVVDSLNSVFEDQLSQLGSNTFIVQKMPSFLMGMKDWRKYMKRKDLDYQQAQLVRDQTTLAQSVSASVQSTSIVRAHGESTESPQRIMGGDERYLEVFGFNVESGRGLTYEDVLYKREVAVIGADIAKRLFRDRQPLGNTVAIGSKTFLVVGVLEAKGSVIGQSQDGIVIIPITAHLKYLTSRWGSSLVLSVKAANSTSMDATMDQVIGILRIARKVQPGDENDFEIMTNSSLTASFQGFTKYLTYFSAGVAAICLLAAGIGIMNIMLVSVKERTREIGVRKALGATRGNILTQFVIEAITMCQLGGAIGIVLGVIGGNVIALYMKTSVVFPWQGTIIAVVVCTVIGVAFGGYPAWRASLLDPIDALRYE